jgi:hypothetical protein
MLSVANIAAGAEISVKSSWVSAMTYVSGQGGIRIPLTVGDIYGRSPLPDSDDILVGGPLTYADVNVSCDSGIVRLNGKELRENGVQVPMNRPIDIQVENQVFQELSGRAANGQNVTLSISPHSAGTTRLNVAILVDHSGSMAEQAIGDPRSATKHQAVINSLGSLAEALWPQDQIDIWEFDNRLNQVGKTDPSPDVGENRGNSQQQLRHLVGKLSPPEGGTEIGEAIAGVVQMSTALDILLITDGKSYALDIQQLAQSGRRISVVLIGHDSLEANVGALAAQSGGSIFIASDSDISEVLLAAIDSLRMPFEQPKLLDGDLSQIQIVRGNTQFNARWSAASATSDRVDDGHAVAAFCAGLAIPLLDEARAAELAEREGLVCHLTSLILVDEAGEISNGLPANRKIALPDAGILCLSIDTAHYEELAALDSDRSLSASWGSSFHRQTAGVRQVQSINKPSIRLRSLMSRINAGISLQDVANEIDWDDAPNEILSGDLSTLDSTSKRLILQAAQSADAVRIAAELGVSEIVVILAAMAWSQSKFNRSAARIAKSIFGETVESHLMAFFASLGLT